MHTVTSEKCQQHDQLRVRPHAYWTIIFQRFGVEKGDSFWPLIQPSILPSLTAAINFRRTVLILALIEQCGSSSESYCCYCWPPSCYGVSSLPKRNPQPGRKVKITTATAQKGDIGVYLDAIGTVTPVYTASITSQVNGVVVAVHYKEGQLVKKGDPLIDIDSRPYRATLLQAQGALERDENLLAQARWISSVTGPPGRATPSRSKFWMIRKSWCCRTKAQ